jgi:hypothetical protein
VKIVAVFICLVGVVAPSWRGAGAPTNQWNTFVLWSNQVLSASIKYMPEASLADENYMFFELDNHTDKALEVAQAWLGLPAIKINKQTQSSSFMTGMAGGVVYAGKLPPGITKATQHGAFEAGLANLGLPPKEGFHVEITPRADVRLADGTTFLSHDSNRKFHFEFNDANATQVESMKSRFKELLAHPDDRFGSGYYLSALSQVPEVGDSVTRDELLSALKSRSWVDGKGAIMTIVGRRFPNDPGVLAYFEDQLSRDDGDAFFSFPREVWQNAVFVEPLVKRYEKNGKDSRELLQMRPAWIGNQQIVARLSSALLKRHPVLNQNVAELSVAELCDWQSAVDDAGIIGNTNFLKWLKPALDDKRIVPDCLSKYDSRPRAPWDPRICDCALGAILMIVDGDSWSAFKKAGVPGWRTKEEDYAAHDRIITELKNRLKPD